MNFLEGVRYLKVLTELVAFVLCLILIGASCMITYKAIVGLLSGDPSVAIQQGLFVVILLEMFYVVRSFIKYGSVNVGIIINVGIIALVKEMVFKIDQLNLQMAISFSIVLLSLGVVYLLETLHFNNKKREKHMLKDLMDSD